MQIDSTTQLSIASAIMSSGLITSTTSSSSSDSFGPSALLSLGDNLTSSSDTYSNLAASLFASMPIASAVIPSEASGVSSSSQTLTDAELEQLEAAFDLLNNGEYEEAKEALNKMLDRNKNSAAVIHGLGLVESVQGNYKEAEAFFRRADYLAPGRGYNEDAENSHILAQDDDTVFAEASKLAQNPSTRAQGIQLLQALTERRPEDAEAKLLMAESMMAEGDILNSINAFFSAVSIADEDQLKQIEAQAENLVDALPQVAQVHRLLGRAQLKLGKYEEALETLDRSADLSETDLYVKTDKALAHVGIGRELLDKGDVSRAITHFKEAQQLDSTNKEVKIARAEGYLASAERYQRYGNLSKAITEYNTASGSLGSLGSESLRNRIARGAYSAGVRMEQKHTAAGEDLDEEALAYQAAYNLDKDNLAYKRKLAETRNTIGDQFLAEEEYKAAIGAYKQAYNLYKNDETYKGNLLNAQHTYGDQLMSEKRYTEAIEVYREAYQLDTYNVTSKTKLAEAYTARGLDYYEKGKYLKALPDFKEALFLFPENTTYQDNYALVSAYDS